MNNKEIKIKSYLYLQQNLSIFVFLMFGIPTIIISIYLRPFSIPAVLSIGIISLFFLILALITRLGCKTYDIYNELGIKRIRGDKIIFEVEWKDVGSLMYYGILEVLVLSPYVLNIFLQNKLTSNEDRNYDNITILSTPMSKRTLMCIEKLIPIEIKKVR